MQTHNLEVLRLSTPPRGSCMRGVRVGLALVMSAMLALTAAVLTAGCGPARLITVSSTTDDQPGSLREALRQARPGDTIAFDSSVFPPASPATIRLQSELPHISRRHLTIDASQAGVILDGADVQGSWPVGLEITSDGNVVRGLRIQNFALAIVLSHGASRNRIGGDQSRGVGPNGEGNILVLNQIGLGVCGRNTSFNVAAGNLIGTDGDRLAGLGNARSGVWIAEEATCNTIGPANVIALNTGNGVEISGARTSRNTLLDNRIYGNVGAGVLLTQGANEGLPSPYILDADLGRGTVSGVSPPNCTVAISSDPSGQGAVLEGTVKSDATGFFTLSKATGFVGPSLSVMATDDRGNSSGFGGPPPPDLMQLVPESMPREPLVARDSRDLPDNGIGRDCGSYISSDKYPEYLSDYIFDLGFTWVRIAFTEDPLNWQNVERSPGQYSVDPEVDAAVTQYAQEGVTVVLNLGVGNGDGRPDATGMATEDEVERYVNYARFLVHHFKGRVTHYEIWNEAQSVTPYSNLTTANYANLIAHAAQAIHEEDSKAKVVVGAVSGIWLPGFPGYGASLRNTLEVDYLKHLIGSGVIHLADVISWHPLYGNLADDPYYQGYPGLVKEIKALAAENGFRGEFMAEEIVWRAADELSDPELPRFSKTACAKYFTRAMFMHRGLGVLVSLALPASNEEACKAVHNVNDVLAGAQPADLGILVRGDVADLQSYTFTYPDGDRLVAMWTNGPPSENEPGIPVTVVLPGLGFERVIGIDVLGGFTQELSAFLEENDLVIPRLVVRDYPIVLRIGSGG